MKSLESTPEKYIKKGAAVRVKIVDHFYYAGSMHTTDKGTHKAIITSYPRNSKGRFASAEDFWWDDVKDIELQLTETGRTVYADAEDIYPDTDISSLSYDDYKQLREQISAGSIYTSDYNNTFGVDENVVYDYAEAYINYIEEEGIEDTPDNFAEYMCSAA